MVTAHVSFVNIQSECAMLTIRYWVKLLSLRATGRLRNKGHYVNKNSTGDEMTLGPWIGALVCKRKAYYIYSFMCVHVWLDVCERVHMLQCGNGCQRPTCCNYCSPIVWVLGIQLKSTGLVLSIFTQGGSHCFYFRLEVCLYWFLTRL